MNKRRVFLVFALNIFVPLFLFATEESGRSAQTLIPPRHWIYDSLQILEQESGIVQFSDQAPLAIQQIRAMLDEIDYDSLSEPGKEHYDNIIEYFNETGFSVQGSIVQVRIEPTVNLEGYVKTNDSVSWLYDRYEKQKFIELPVTIAVGDYAALFADISVGTNKTTMNDNENYFNIPYSEETLDVNFPHNAYGSLGKMFTDGVGVNFHFSNMPQSFGRAQTGSIIQSEYLTDATNASLALFSSILQYTASLTQLNTDRYMYSHKIDVRIGRKKKFQISAMEACIPYGSMDLRFFNPMMIFHNYASWLDYQAKNSDVGSYFAFKMNFAPIKHLRIFGLWSMTQFQLSAELNDNDFNNDNYVPNAMGWQGGVESFIPIGYGHLHFNLEGYYAQPYLYINSSPNWSFVRTSSESTSGSEDFYEWVGTRYGPDTVAASFNAEYSVPKKWSIGLKYLFLARGELSDPDIFKRAGWGPRILDIGSYDVFGRNSWIEQNWVYPRWNNNYRNGRDAVAPSGTEEYANALSLYGSYYLFDWLRFILQPSVAFISNSGHISGETDFAFECVLSVQCKFTKIKKRGKDVEIELEE